MAFSLSSRKLQNTELNIIVASQVIPTELNKKKMFYS